MTHPYCEACQHDPCDCDKKSHRDYVKETLDCADKFFGGEREMPMIKDKNASLEFDVADFYDIVYEEQSTSRLLAKMCNMKLKDIKAEWAKGVVVETVFKAEQELKDQWLAELKSDAIEVFLPYLEKSVWSIKQTEYSKFRGLIPRAFIEEIHKKTCEHVGRERYAGIPDQDVEFICAQCGAKLKAKWEIVE